MVSQWLTDGLSWLMVVKECLTMASDGQWSVNAGRSSVTTVFSMVNSGSCWSMPNNNGESWPKRARAAVNDH